VIAIVLDVVLNSLYSIRSPLTWQSALTYPVMPPSAVIGLLANALQRYRNNEHPLKLLSEIENKVFWSASRLLQPSIISSCTISAIVKWEMKWGDKCTNVLVKEFACGTKMQLAAVLKMSALPDEWIEAVKRTPLTCGDSESPISVENVEVLKVEEFEGTECTTFFPVPFEEDTQLIKGTGISYWMHERCQQSGKTFPLKCYMVPIMEENGLLVPTKLTVKSESRRILSIEKLGAIIA